MKPKESKKKAIEDNNKKVEDNFNKEKKLSPQAKKWQEYLNKIGVTPEMYLRRYPDHRHQEFIKELL